MADPATVFHSKVRQYRRLGYDMVEVDEQALRAKVRVAVAGASDAFQRFAADGKRDIFRLIEVDSTGKVHDERVYS